MLKGCATEAGQAVRQAVEQAVEGVLEEGYRTADIAAGGDVINTGRMGSVIAGRV